MLQIRNNQTCSYSLNSAQMSNYSQHFIPIQIRPDKSWSATFKKRLFLKKRGQLTPASPIKMNLKLIRQNIYPRLFAIRLLNCPFSFTSEYRFSKFSRGTTTLLNHNLPLSTPL